MGAALAVGPRGAADLRTMAHDALPDSRLQFLRTGAKRLQISELSRNDVPLMVLDVMHAKPIGEQQLEPVQNIERPQEVTETGGHHRETRHVIPLAGLRQRLCPGSVRRSAGSATETGDGGCAGDGTRGRSEGTAERLRVSRYCFFVGADAGFRWASATRIIALLGG